MTTANVEIVGATQEFPGNDRERHNEQQTELNPGWVDEGLARRMKALACTAPLNDLDSRKAHLDWAKAEAYQMAQIALHLIDQVTITMDFDRGARHDQVVQRALPFVAAQAPERDEDEHAHVARWVLNQLLNVGNLDRGFRTSYGFFSEDGRFQTRWFDFKLLVEVTGLDGEIFLRATDEAINVLVGALDTDVESAQIAAEVKLENLVSRGRLSDAKLAAEHARYRTIQYGDLLRHRLEATRRDVRSVDWENEIPDLIDSALEHVSDRYAAENAIIANITATRDEADDPIKKRQAAELIDIVEECIRRHTTLQGRLTEAGAVFRAEQDRQQFSGEVHRSATDLFGELLAPVLKLAVADAAAPAGAFFSHNAGLRVSGVLNLAGLAEMLLAEPVERDQLSEALAEPELAPLPDLETFSEELFQQATALLDIPTDAPRRLSGVLAEARQHDHELAALIALLSVHAVDPHLGEALRHGESSVLLAIDDGTTLDDPEFGGADLLLLGARLDRHAPAATSAAASTVDSGYDTHDATTDASSSPWEKVA